ncbi:MAG: DUF5677 domain-containing protein [Solirubrobacterales bacterium]
MRELHPQIEDGLTQVERRHDTQLRACEKLLDFVLGAIVPWRGRALEREHDGLIAAIFARTTNTYWSALELARMGFGEQASMLNRSLFEDMVDLHWIADNPETAIEHYDQHNRHGEMLLADALRKHPEFMPAGELPAVHSEERARLDKLFGQYGHRSWTTTTLYDRVESIEHWWGQRDDVRHLQFFRDVVHRDNNQLLHVSAHSLNQMVRRSGPDAGGLALKLGPGDEYLDRALFSSFWIYAQSVGLLLEHFEFAEHHDFGQLFQELAPQFHRLSDDEIRRVGRNDPCPCGSGKKFKHCHGA